MPPLEWQPVEIQLGGSMDESQQAFTLPPNILQELRNARVYKTGAVGKRPGWIAQAVAETGDRCLSVDDQLFMLRQHTVAAPAVTAAMELGTVNNELQRVDYQGGFSGAFSLSEVEVLERKALVRDILSGDGAGSLISSGPDIAVSAANRIAVIAWEVALAALPSIGVIAQHAIFAMAIDVETRQPVSPPRQISGLVGSPGSASGPFVVMADANVAVVGYAITSLNQIRVTPFDCSTRTWGAEAVPVSDLNPAGVHYDSCELVGGTGWYLAWRNTTPLLRIAKMSGTTVSATTTLAEDSSKGSCAIYADNATNNLWIAYYDATNGIRAIIKNATTIATTVLATQTIEAPADTVRQMTWGVFTSGMVLVWTTAAVVTLAGSGYGRKLTKFRSMTPLGVKGNVVTMADVELLSKAIAPGNGYLYCAVIYDGSDTDATNVQGQRSLENQVAFTMEIVDNNLAATASFGNPFRVAATWAIGEAGRNRLNGSLSNFRAVAVGADPVEAWFMLAPEFDQIFLGGAFQYIAGRPGVDLCRQRFNNQAPVFAAQIGPNIVFSGGTPQVWDGAHLSEYGFLIPPENCGGLDSAPTGSLTAGTYAAQMVWEYRLATGDMVRSVPAQVQSAPGVFNIPVALTGDRITVLAPSLNLTRKWNENTLGFGQGVILRAYRTEANGTVYYEEGDFTQLTGFAANVPLPVNLSVPIIQADATAITHPAIYTQGGILPNFPPPALSFIYTHRNRLFGIVAENRRQIQFTHEYVAGELPGWHPDLVIDVPDEVVALATIDEKLVILCRNGIYLISGNGPDRKGLNSDYDQPFRLNSPHGCITAESVVSFPNGVIYQAAAGFCLMDRTTTVTRVGGPVEDVLVTYPYAHASLVIQETEWIYWSVTDKKRLSDSTTGRTICFDWRHNVWSVDLVVVPGELVPSPTWATSFARTSAGVFSTVGATASLYLQGGSADPGPQWIYTYFKTAMINLGSNSKYQRARWLTALGENRGIHQMAFTVTTFHHATSAPLQQFFVWTNAQLAPMQDYALKMHLKNQVGAFVQIEVADGPDASFPATFDDSARFVTLVLEVGMKRGTHQVAQAATE